MNIAIFGIGYVGAVLAGCLPELGHRVVAADINPAKVDAINAGRSPVFEPGLAERIASAVRTGALRATCDAADAFAHGDVLFICVGTPGTRGSRLDLGQLAAVLEDLGRRIAASDDRRRTIVIRSTIPPGTMDEVVRPVLEHAAGMAAGSGFGLALMPEFLREGQGVADFLAPPVTVVGAADEASFAAIRPLLPQQTVTVECDCRTAEAIKFANNAFHALKIAFANEIGAVCKGAGIDGRRVMDILCEDTRLNVSRAYLRPGFAFGGSCLPKDVRALCHLASQHDVRTAVLDALLPSNDAHIGRAVAIVAGWGQRRVSLLGLTFKPGTDDLRDSPFVELAERLIGKGYSLRIYDPNFSLGGLVGRNRQALLAALPHIGALLVDTMDAALDHAETIIVGHGSPDYAGLADMPPDRYRVLDLASAVPGLQGAAHYQGICW